jgi:stress response protein YsnF
MPASDPSSLVASLVDPPVDRAGADRAAAESNATVVPLVAESLAIATVARQVGALRVRVVVDESTERVGTDVVREEYRPTLRPVGVAASERRAPYQNGDDLVIPIYEERWVAEKRLYLKEEVRLQRVRQGEQQVSDVPVRRERAIVERQQADGSWREVAAEAGAPVAEHASSSPGRSARD